MDVGFAHPNPKDRWDHTPVYEAMLADSKPVINFLRPFIKPTEYEQALYFWNFKKAECLLVRGAGGYCGRCRCRRPACCHC